MERTIFCWIWESVGAGRCLLAVSFCFVFILMGALRSLLIAIPLAKTISINTNTHTESMCERESHSLAFTTFFGCHSGWFKWFCYLHKMGQKISIEKYAAARMAQPSFTSQIIMCFQVCVSLTACWFVFWPKCESNGMPRKTEDKNKMKKRKVWTNKNETVHWSKLMDPIILRLANKWLAQAFH